MATRSSILPWRIPWTEEPCGLQPIGWEGVTHDWGTKLAHGSHFMHIGRPRPKGADSEAGISAWSWKLRPRGGLPSFLRYSAFVGWKFSSVAQSCLTLCNPMDCSMPGLPVHHQLPELVQTHVH